MGRDDGGPELDGGHPGSAVTRHASSPPGPGKTPVPDVFGIVGTLQAGSFHVEAPVAEGGFGVVYRAQHGAFRAPVALKCLKIPGQLDAVQRASFLEKFRAEAELLFRLSGTLPEVVRPLHVDQLHTADGRFAPFLALEWLDGESLSSIIETRTRNGKAPLPLDRVVSLLRPIARALSRAHRFPSAEGEIAIIHRDLKPENIFVAKIEGRTAVRILDYGIAKARAAASTGAGRATNDQVNVFTPAYAAPEQWAPQKYGQTGPFTDVYGLAMTLVEACIGRPPLDGELHTMLAAALDPARRPTPGAYGTIISDELEQVFARALAVDPRERTKTIAAFWTELEDALGLPRSMKTDAPEPRSVSLDSVPPPARPGAVASPSAATLAFSGELELDMPKPSPAPPPSGPNRSPAPPPAPAYEPDDDFDVFEHNASMMVQDVASSSGADSRRGSRPASRRGASGPAASRPAARRPVPRPGTLMRARPSEGGWPEIRRKIAGPVKILIVAGLITAADVAAVQLYQTELMIGPVHMSWIAGPLACYAFFTAVWRFFSDS